MEYTSNKVHFVGGSPYRISSESPLKKVLLAHSPILLLLFVRFETKIIRLFCLIGQEEIGEDNRGDTGFKNY